MKFRTLAILLIFLVVSSFASLAQDDDRPTVALVSFGNLRPLNLAQQGSLDLFSEYGYEDGENIDFIVVETEFNIDVLETIMTAVLEQEPDVIIASATPVAIMAIAMTSDMENPPVILINAVTSVYGTGIAQSPCIKPDHVSGSQALPPFDLMLSLISDFDPDIQRLGIIYNEDEANSVFSVGLIRDFGEEQMFEIIEQAVTSADVVPAVSEAILVNDIDAFLIPPDATVFSAIPDITNTATLAGIPVITTVDDQVYSGATLGIGLDYYQEGVDIARMAIAYLNGDIDIATTAISEQTGLSIAVNLDSAAEQNIDVPESFLERANYVIENGDSSEQEPALASMSHEERETLDTEFLDALFCSAERIAEEQAELDG